MAKTSEEQLDKKEIEKTLKKIKLLRERIKACNKGLKGLAQRRKRTRSADWLTIRRRQRSASMLEQLALGFDWRRERSRCNPGRLSKQS